MVSGRKPCEHIILYTYHYIISFLNINKTYLIILNELLMVSGNAGEEENPVNRGVLLQYTTNNGVAWATINYHEPTEFSRVGSSSSSSGSSRRAPPVARRASPALLTGLSLPHQQGCVIVCVGVKCVCSGAPLCRAGSCTLLRGASRNVRVILCCI